MELKTLPTTRKLVRLAERAGELLGPRRRLLRRLPKHGVCAEIGVWKGQFSQRILDSTSPRELHLVDPWAFQTEFPDRMYGGSVAKSADDMDAIHAAVAQQFANDPRVKIHRDYSEPALGSFPDDYFDWVYVDGNHYYDFVLKDLELAFQKVKPGGFIAGDDYDWGAKIGHPVKTAVQDFVNKHPVQKLEVLGNQFLLYLH